MRLAMELKEAKEEAIAENNELVIRNLLEMHMSIDFIAKAIGQSQQYVQQFIGGWQMEKL